jgi:hypothetical protein
MERDYKSFSGIANTRFRNMANHFGFIEISKTFYAKQTNDIFYVYCLQKSVGNDFFYINYGIAVPYLWSKDKTLNFRDIKGWHFGQRLENNYRQGFDCKTKLEVSKSADLAKKFFEEQAIPWFNKFQSLKDVAELFYKRNIISEENIGTSKNKCGSEALNYAFFYYHLNYIDKAKLWFSEAKRLYSLPIYCVTKVNVVRIVHERPKGARKYNPGKEVRDALDLINSMREIL